MSEPLAKLGAYVIRTPDMEPSAAEEVVRARIQAFADAEGYEVMWDTFQAGEHPKQFSLPWEDPASDDDVMVSGVARASRRAGMSS